MATCAACGVALRSREKYRLVDCYVLHELCVNWPRGAWVAEAELRRLQREAIEERGEAARARVEAEHLRSRVREEEAQERVLRARKADLEDRVRDLTAAVKLLQASQRLERIERVPEPRVARARAAVVTPASRDEQLAASISRLFFDMVVWFSRVALETEDASLARYRLLEL